MKAFALGLGLMATVSSADGRDPSWFTGKMAYLDSLGDHPSQEDLPKLRILAGITARPSDAEQQQVAARAQELVLEIPGAIDYYAGEIKEITDRQLEGSASPSDLLRRQDASALSQFRRPESVKALGELLFDERDPSKGVPSDSSWLPTCFYAEDALFKMGIKNPPVPKTKFPVLRDDLHKWQDWYQEVKSGKRTFSFEGDDNVYSLSGRVEVSTSGRSIHSTLPRSQPLATETDAPASQGSRSEWLLAVALAVAAIAGVAALRMSGRRNAP